MTWVDDMEAAAESVVPARHSIGTHYAGRAIRRAWTRPAVSWGAPYGGHHLTRAGNHGEPRWMQRRGQRVRWYDGDGAQVGPEQANVAPALAWAASRGWL